MQEPIVDCPAKGKCDGHVQLLLAVILQDAGNFRKDNDGEKCEASEVEAAEPGFRIQTRIQKHSVNDKPHEQRFYHFQPGDHNGKEKNGRKFEAMRPEPAEIDT